MTVTVKQFVDAQLAQQNHFSIGRKLNETALALMDAEGMVEYTGQQCGFSHAMLQGPICRISPDGNLVAVEKKSWSTLQYYAGMADDPKDYFTLGDWRFYDGDHRDWQDVVYSCIYDGK